MLCDMFMRCSEGGEANIRCSARVRGSVVQQLRLSLAVCGPPDQQELGGAS
jgi:hypothetical protein